ncbi:MAG: ZIP family metal transporter [Syntrophomonadaceae bacterium]|nr:ZIP family metal transporter [Syntrophomonadaceae bacterium]
MPVNEFGFSVAAGVATFLGALLVFWRVRMRNKELSFFLGLAAGVMLAVVVFDLIPSVFVMGGRGGFLLGAMGGAVIIALFNNIINKSGPSGGARMAKIGYMIMLGIALHDLPEGMAISLGHEVSTRTAAAIALGIGIHNIPEGMAIAAPLIMGGISKMRIALQVLAVGAVTPLGFLLGKLAVSVLPHYFGVFMGLASGVMLYLVIFQLWPEARMTGSTWRYWGGLLGVLVILVATLGFR